MPTTRMLARIERLLDEADDALAHGDWSRVRELAGTVLRLDPDNEDGRVLMEAAEPSRTELTPEPDVDAQSHRRHLTVMFCDLVDSTPLAERLDPEDLRDVLREYQWAAAGVVERHGGQIARYQGDGLLVYFGFPRAHEDDAKRAVRAGLEIVRSVDALNERRTQGPEVRFAARVGIHTGLAVIADMGAGARTERDDVVGETPNVAARLQALAEPGSVCVSAQTHALIGSDFDCRALPAQRLKGLSGERLVYRVMADKGHTDRVESRAAQLTPFVGRSREVLLVSEHWMQCSRGSTQVVALRGEAGVGKSRILQEAVRRLDPAPTQRLQLRCSELHQTSALQPLFEMIRRVLAIALTDAPEERGRKVMEAIPAAMDAESAALAAHFMGAPLPETFPMMTPEQLRHATFVALKTWLILLARQAPTVFIAEDLHWADPSTLEFLESVVLDEADAAVLVLMTYRPEFIPPWPQGTHASWLEVGRLDEATAAEMIRTVAGGKSLPPAVVEGLLERADGVPLYIEELTAGVLESGELQERESAFTSPGDSAVTIPATLHDSLMAKLDRMSRYRELYQVSSVFGREFSLDLLREVTKMPAAQLADGMDALVAAGIFRQRGTPPAVRFTFKHALVREAAYQSLLRSRRRELHGLVARALVDALPEETEHNPEVVAAHFTAAGKGEEATAYWKKAAQHAVAQSAHAEAVRHLEAAIRLVKQLPRSEQTARMEVELQLGRARSVTATDGYIAAGPAYARSRELCAELPVDSSTISTLYGINGYHLVRAEHQVALELGEQLLELAGRGGDAQALIRAHGAILRARFCLGDLVGAVDHVDALERILSRENARGVPYRRTSTAHLLHNYAPLILAILGERARALAIADEAYAYCPRLMPFEAATSLVYLSWLHQFLRNDEECLRFANEAITLTVERRFPFFEAAARVFRGWVRTRQTKNEDALGDLVTGIATWRSLGSEIVLPNFYALEAECHLELGEPLRALGAVQRSISQADRTGERYYYPEILRIRGAVLREMGNAQGSIESIQEAVALADGQRAVLWRNYAKADIAPLGA